MGMELYYSYETRNGFSMSVVNLRLKLVFFQGIYKSHTSPINIKASVLNIRGLKTMEQSVFMYV